jgi:hypothetical protein
VVLDVLVQQVPGGEGLVAELALMSKRSGKVDVLNMHSQIAP